MFLRKNRAEKAQKRLKDISFEIEKYFSDQ